MRAAAAIALTVAAAAGCGGGGSSAEDTRAELRRWVSAVDEVCRVTREKIVQRGYARDTVELHSVAQRASAEVRAAIERIRDVPISEQARPRVRGFLTQLDRIGPSLSEMTETTKDGTLNEIGKLGIRLADATKLLQDRADAAGLRECSDRRQFDAVLDTFTAPVYAFQVVRVEVWLGRADRRLGKYRRPGSAGFVPHLRRVAKVLDGAERRIDDLVDFRPNRAVEAADDLHFALDGYEEFLSGLIGALEGGRRVLSPVGVRQFNRGVARHRRKVRRSIAALEKAIGARPFAVPAPEPELDSA